MALTLHTLRPSKGSQKRRKRVGRGNASGKGTYSTRGLKGQRSRSGGKSGLKRRGLRANLQNIPKLRGFTSNRPEKQEVSLSLLDTVCIDGDIVTPAFLIEKSVIKGTKGGVKILSNGDITKKITIEKCAISASAAEKVKAAGGEIKE